MVYSSTETLLLESTYSGVPHVVKSGIIPHFLMQQRLFVFVVAKREGEGVGWMGSLGLIEGRKGYNPRTF